MYLPSLLIVVLKKSLILSSLATLYSCSDFITQMLQTLSTLYLDKTATATATHESSAGTVTCVLSLMHLSCIYCKNTLYISHACDLSQEFQSLFSLYPDAVAPVSSTTYFVQILVLSQQLITKLTVDHTHMTITPLQLTKTGESLMHQK